MSTPTCQGFKCHSPSSAELRTYRAPGRWSETKTYCRDCFESLVCSNSPPPPGQEFERLPLVQAEAKQIHAAATAAVFDLAAEIKSQAIAMNRVIAAQIAQIVPVAPEVAPAKPEPQEEVEYLRQQNMVQKLALAHALNFALAIAQAPINAEDEINANETIHTIKAALAGKPA